ncbi:MAG: S-layer homology domain-containing protein, partial [Oscillospiraceae bacterium]|nr:S-layer homology domain-containing protein [Oscillospiraceae bacterium]
NEVAFLLYKGILTTDELGTYLNNATASLKRYEAAILLTKLMGAEEQVNNNISVVLGYADTPEIPTAALASVEYVTQHGLMRGLEGNLFGPNDNVTRVQIAIILSRVLDTLDYSTVIGTVNNVIVSTESGTSITITKNDGIKANFDINKDITVIIDGTKSNPANITKGSKVLLLYSGDELVAFEALSTEENLADNKTDNKNDNKNDNKTDNNSDKKDEDTKNNGNSDRQPANNTAREEITGRLANLITDDEIISFSVIDEGTTNRFTLTDDSDVIILLDNKAVDIDALKNGLTVIVTVNDGEVISIAAESGTQTISGTVRSIDEDDMVISIRTSSGSTVRYELGRNVRISLNSAPADLEDLSANDEVTITVVNGAITAIAATGTNGEISGTISAITISAEPKLTIETSGREQSYGIGKNAKITIGGKTSTIYDLRLGDTVSAKLNSGIITSVTATVSPSTYQKTGTITAINTSNSYITMNIDGKSERIYASKKSNGTVIAKIIDNETGDSMKFSDLAKGDTVTAIGSYNDDDQFVATTIVLIEID